MDFSSSSTSAISDTSPLLAKDSTNHSVNQNPFSAYHSINSRSEEDTSRQVPQGETIHHQTRQVREDEKYSATHGKDEKADNNPECAVYKRRWYILFAYWMVFVTQVTTWNTWGPIALTTKDAFGWVDRDIALLSNWGCITYALSAFFFSWLLDTKGLRIAVGSAAVLNFIGTAVRCLPVGVHHLKWTAHIGQILIGFAGPVCQGGSPVLSATWFPANQRTTSTAIATVAAVIGTSASFALGPIIVTDVTVMNDTEILPAENISNESLLQICKEGFEILPEVQQYHYQEVMLLLYIECALALFCCFLIVIYFPAKPPKPPSISASTQREDFITGAFDLARHREFWLLGTAYALSLGIGQAWMTQMAIIFEDTMNVDQDTTGRIVFLASFLGIFGALFFGRVADLLGGKMKQTLLLNTCAGILLFTWFILLATGCIKFNLAMLYVCIISIFFLFNGAIPLYYEITAEASYPIAEGIVTLTITWLMNLFGLIFLSVLMVPGIDPSWMNYVILGTVCLTLPLLLLHRENYARHSLDVTTQSQSNSINTSNSV